MIPLASKLSVGLQFAPRDRSEPYRYRYRVAFEAACLIWTHACFAGCLRERLHCVANVLQKWWDRLSYHKQFRMDGHIQAELNHPFAHEQMDFTTSLRSVRHMSELQAPSSDRSPVEQGFSDLKSDLRSTRGGFDLRRVLH